MSSRKGGPVSQYERRAARQRQLAQMEAAASGTQASMQLNTGGEEEGQFVSMRQRNQETARRFLYDEDEGVQTTATAKNTTTAANLFGGREEHGMEGVNLMDHETGIYTQQDTTLTGRIRRFFLGPDQGPGEHDAIAADSEVYLGDRASRSSSIFVRLRTLLCSTKQRMLACSIVFFALLSVAFYSVHATRKSRMSPEELLFSENSERFKEIWEVITLEGVSDPNALLTTTSPQARALRWLAYSDGARMNVNDPMLVQRYSLAVFFFNSFMAFARHTGIKPKIENGDEQYQDIPVSGWYSQDYWMTEKGYCSWYGVECQAKQQNGIQVRKYDGNANIYALNLTYNYVWGHIPDEIMGLQTVERMDLSRNRLSGSFPGEVRRLTKLRILKLHDNSLEGVLPTEMGLMQSAVEIDISNNEIEGYIPTEINRLTNLQVIKFSKNQFTKQIPEMASLTNIHTVHMDENRLSGTFPFTLVQTRELRELYLEKNRIGGTLPGELMTLSKLRIFSVHNNKFQGEFPNGMFRSNLDLEYLSIQFNNFTGSIPTRAGTLANLHTLQMHDNSFTGSFPTEWTSMDSLEVLHLQNNKMHGVIPTTIGKLKHVKEIWLNNNEISGPLPTELSGCAALELAYFDHNSLSGKLPDLGKLGNLNTLRLEGNSITGSVPQAICDLRTFKLRFLSADCKANLTCTQSCCTKCY